MSFTSKAANLLGRIFDSIPVRTVESIKRGFFGVVFIMAIGSIILGYRMGTRSAQIKSPSLINSTKDVFDIDMSREKDGGNFSDMLDDEFIQEEKKVDAERLKFPVQEKMEPEIDEGIIEAPTAAKRKKTPGVHAEEPVIEGEYQPKHAKKGDVKEIGKGIHGIDTSPDLITGDEKASKEPLSEESIATPPKGQTGGKKTLHKIKGKQPQPLHEDSGIIKN